MKIRDLISNYLKHMEFVRSASPLTLRHYSLDLKQAFTSQKDPLGLREAKEELLLAECRRALQGWGYLSLASRNRKIATLKSFLGWVFDERLIERDLAQLLHCPSVPKKIPHFISVDESLSILHSFDLSQIGQERARLLFLLLYGGGLRVSEACRLKRNDLLLTQRSLRVRGKGGKERQILLPQLCVKALQSWLRQHPDGDYIFGISPLDPRVAYGLIRQAGAQAGLLKPLNPHALRHSYATHLLGSGANLRTLQELLGHKSLSATEKYTHLSVDHLARTLEGFHPLGKKSSA